MSHRFPYASFLTQFPKGKDSFPTSSSSPSWALNLIPSVQLPGLKECSDFSPINSCTVSHILDIHPLLALRYDLRFFLSLDSSNPFLINSDLRIPPGVKTRAGSSIQLGAYVVS